MGLMIQTVADVVQAKINVHISNDKEAKTIFGRYPYLTTENETLCTAESIAQHIARLNPQAGLNGTTQFQKAMVNEWIAWCESKWLPIMHGPLLPVLGFKPIDQKEYAKALAEAKKIAKELDDHLKHQEQHSNFHWIVYDHMSLADIFIGSCFITCF